jgi:uncharacterized protein YeaO (DUF488 family)
MGSHFPARLAPFLQAIAPPGLKQYYWYIFRRAKTTHRPGKASVTFRIKRIYEPAEERDGLRILVDRVWPRGISRFGARLTRWDRDVAPTTELRRWFGHRPEHWTEFQRRYRAELAHNSAVAELRKLGKDQSVTLLYAARDIEHNHARVLLAVLGRRR